MIARSFYNCCTCNERSKGCRTRNTRSTFLGRRISCMHNPWHATFHHAERRHPSDLAINFFFPHSFDYSPERRKTRSLRVFDLPLPSSLHCYLSWVGRRLVTYRESAGLRSTGRFQKADCSDTGCNCIDRVHSKIQKRSTRSRA